jgi:LAO/AO transport system kinase
VVKPAADEQQRLVAALRAGERRALARALSWVESGHPGAPELLTDVCQASPVPWVIGVTGVGGAGKSTLVPRLAQGLLAEGLRVGILAVDPSSPFSGGAILGDRIRDTGDASSRVFFRSVATRGGSGALAGCVHDLVRVMGAGGFDVVLVETVGAGQSEVAVMELAHTVVLVCAPGLGDEIQAIKAGVMEVADLIVVNKADLPGAEATAHTLRQALGLPMDAHHLAEGRNDDGQGPCRWHTPVVMASSISGQGLDQVRAQVLAHRQTQRDNGDYAARDRQRDRWRMQQLFTQLVVERATECAARMSVWSAIEAELADRTLDPWTAAARATDSVISACFKNRQETT